MNPRVCINFGTHANFLQTSILTKRTDNTTMHVYCDEDLRLVGKVDWVTTINKLG